MRAHARSNASGHPAGWRRRCFLSVADAVVVHGLHRGGVFSAGSGEAITAPEGVGIRRRCWSRESVRAQLAEASGTRSPRTAAMVAPTSCRSTACEVDDVWYYGGSPKTIRVGRFGRIRNGAMHLADPWRVVVVEGEVRVTKLSHDFAQRLAGIASEKYSEYGIRFDASSYSKPGLCHPQRVISSSSFPGRTRFTFVV